MTDWYDMYADLKFGCGYRHKGYIIKGLWLDVFRITNFFDRKD
ncbi:hypothetical protein LCGC14_1330240 [marine sediment metagenome]|uniref:Uncharacterized protein n=1 Tax=marine sediment metagenome TaxID=412755 RepID=A0A0F9KHI4_9ZZZZ